MGNGVAKTSSVSNCSPVLACLIYRVSEKSGVIRKSLTPPQNLLNMTTANFQTRLQTEYHVYLYPSKHIRIHSCAGVVNLLLQVV
jgi:hypothetical protein